MPFKKPIVVLTILLVAEIVASMLVWSGKPMDGTWEPSFWRFEVSRLRFWVLFISVSLAAAQFAWYGLGRLEWLDHSRTAAVSRVVVVAVLGFLAEYLTSFYYSRNLPWRIAAYVGWSYRPSYIYDHLWGWLISSSTLFLAWFFIRRRRAGSV